MYVLYINISTYIDICIYVYITVDNVVKTRATVEDGEGLFLFIWKDSCIYVLCINISNYVYMYYDG
jgi:hypothetical protein